MSQTTDPSPADGDDLLALADAVNTRPAAPPPPPPVKVWGGWRVVIALMHAWAAVLFALGLLFCIMTMLTVPVEPRPFRLETTETSSTLYGWGLPTAIAVVMFVLSKLQTRTARRLRARKFPAS